MGTRIVVLGGGFAGIPTAHRLSRLLRGDAAFQITLVSEHNYFLFTPMLAEAATGAVEIRHILRPIRPFCKMTGIAFHQSAVEAIDLVAKRVRIRPPRSGHERLIPYDRLVVALGSVSKFMGLPGVAEHALPLKDVGDAIRIRNHVIEMFEQADIEEDPDRKAALLTFVTVGGGHAGVEIATALQDLMHRTLLKHYNNIRPSELRQVLVAPDILGHRNPPLANLVLDEIHRKGIEARLGPSVTGASAEAVCLSDGQRIPTHTLIWTAGVTAHPVVAGLPCERDRSGRILVNEYFEVPGYPGVYALGDCAHQADSQTGQPYPMTAQAALRQAAAAARVVAAEVRGQPRRPFTFRPVGEMVPLGSHHAVAEIRGLIFRGFFAWWLWRTYYLLRMPGLATKLRLIFDWTIDLFFGRDISEITIRSGRGE